MDSLAQGCLVAGRVGVGRTCSPWACRVATARAALSGFLLGCAGSGGKGMCDERGECEAGQDFARAGLAVRVADRYGRGPRFAGWGWTYLWIRSIVTAVLAESLCLMGWRRSLRGALGLESIDGVDVV